jgi:hypothetical protein
LFLTSKTSNQGTVEYSRLWWLSSSLSSSLSSVSGNRFIGNRKSSIVNRLFWWQSIDDLNRSLLNRGNDLF